MLGEGKYVSTTSRSIIASNLTKVAWSSGVELSIVHVDCVLLILLSYVGGYDTDQPRRLIFHQLARVASVKRVRLNITRPVLRRKDTSSNQSICYKSAKMQEQSWDLRVRQDR